MSDTHAESAAHRPASSRPAAPRTSDDGIRAIIRDNDTTALNGGPARHWFAPGETERARTPRFAAKFASAILIWGALVGLLMLLALTA